MKRFLVFWDSNNDEQDVAGANLQVDQKRTYFGVGVSFVNLTTKLAELISK